jgi:3-phenylpropionate/cinnamic acid dioxygenase small subunit
MTIEELLAREAIRDTLARYNSAGDRLLVEEFVAVFAEDATFEPGQQILHGREEIRRWLTGGVQVGGASTGPAQPEDYRGGRGHFVRHNLTTCRIDLDGPDHASVRTYFVVYTEIGPDHCGYYKDRFVKQGDEWLIGHRTIRLDWINSDSLTGH